MLYSHAGDLRLARELQRRLEEFGRAAGSRLKLFRDETDLAATPNIWSSISAALERSENLVLLASPASANSMWVHRELEYWFDNGRAADRVLIVLSEGEIVWDNQSNDFDWSRTTALPALLQGKFDGEPLYVDLRWWNGIEDTTRMEFQGSVASLAAAIQGRAKSELVSAIRRRRMKRRMTVASAIIVFLTFVFIAFIIFIKGG